MAVLLVGGLVLGSWGLALGARGKHQRAADLAAVSAARAMADAYPRLFEPPLLPDGAPNPRHISLVAYEQLGRDAALHAGRRNGVAIGPADVRFARSFAPTRVTVVARGEARVRVRGSRREAARIPVRARATAELTALGGPTLPASASGGGYHGPLAYRQGKPMRPDTARAVDHMAAAARRDGSYLIVISGYRSDAEQAKLFAAHPDPKWVAPPGKSLHRLGTELDLGPASAYGWLASNAKRFGFIRRYSWEPWH
jgi:D-alanyl-D-alanine carboxypeptidase